MKKVIEWLDLNFEKSIEVFLFAFLLCNVVVEVFRRYCLHDSNPYSEEVAKYTMVAMIFLGIPYAIRYNRHIVCDVLPGWVSQRTQAIVTVTSYALFMLTSVWMIMSCIDLVEMQIMVGKTTQALYLPMWYLTSLVGLGFGLGLVRLVQALYLDIRRYRETGIIHQYSIPEE